MPVESGNSVKVEYTGTLDDGTVFDSSETHGTPLAFKAGVGQVIKGFDDAVLGMEKDDEKEFRLTAEEAYGAPREELVQHVPRENFPKEAAVEAGLQVMLGLANGQQVAATIEEVSDTLVTVNMNHPLAGQALTFRIKVIEYGDFPIDTGDCGCSCDDDGCDSC